MRRLPGARGGVYAYSDDLAQWMENPTQGVRDIAGGGGVGNAPKGESSTVSQPSHGAGAVGVLEPPITPRPELTDAKPRVAGKSGNTRRLLLASCSLIVVIAGTILLFRQSQSNEIRGDAAGTQASAITRHHAPTAKAQELYLRGRYYWNKRTPADLQKALEYFQQAIAIDPDFALAYVGLADSYNLLREYSAMPEDEAYKKAIAAARKAIELDDSLADAHNSLAFDLFYGTLDKPGAEREFQTALKLNPNSELAHHWYATYLATVGRTSEALEQIEIARQLNSSSTSILADKGMILYYAGRTDEAIALLKQLEQTEPYFLSTHRYMALIDLMTGKYELYLGEDRKVAVLSKNDAEEAIVEAAAKGFRHGGAVNMLSARLGEERKLFAEGRLSAYRLAETSSLMGQRQEALNYLRVSRERRESALSALLVDPMLVSLHDDPSYRKLITQVGLAQVATS